VRPFLIVGWLVCVVYSTIPAFWLMVHPFAEHWRSQSRSPYRILVPIWMATWAAMAILTSRWRSLALYRADWTGIPGAILFAVGVYIYWHSGGDFNLKQLSGFPEMDVRNPEQRLVTNGIRARVRHPIYLAHLCEMLAWSMGTGLAVCWALTVFAIVTGAVMIRMEDAELERRFGEKYRQYRVTVPAVIPRVLKVSQL
jgi:protein-S-isoprenylcysteine O-methyltransferase Ste14